MMLFILGILLGSIMPVVAFVFYSRYKAPAVRLARQIESRTRPKGAILDVSEDETDEWLKTITQKDI